VVTAAAFDFDWLVIGSGFGGSVSADRMDDLVSGRAQKGNRPGQKYTLTCLFSCGAAGNRTRSKNDADLLECRNPLRETTRKYAK